jgi:hypothetical protein
MGPSPAGDSINEVGLVISSLDQRLGVGGPHFRQLEPAGRVATADRRASSRRLSPRDDHGILPHSGAKVSSMAALD